MICDNAVCGLLERADDAEGLRGLCWCERTAAEHVCVYESHGLLIHTWSCAYKQPHSSDATNPWRMSALKKVLQIWKQN